MPRTTAALALTALLGLGLVGCSAPASDTDSAPAPVSSTPAGPDAADDAGVADAAGAAEELCATASEAGGDVCVLENATASGDLSFSSYRIVKIIGGAFDGGVEVTGAEQVTMPPSAAVSRSTDAAAQSSSSPRSAARWMSPASAARRS